MQYLDLVGEEPFIHLHLHFQGIQVVPAVDDQQIMGLNPFDTHQDRFDLGGEDVDPADDQHVVGTSAHAADTGMGPAACARLVADACNVAGAVTDQRDSLFGYGGDDQFAVLAMGQTPAGFGIDDLGDEVVLPDMQPIFSLDALDGHTRPHDLGQAVDVDGCQIQLILDFPPHGLGPGFGTEDADPQLEFFEIDPLRPRLLGHEERVGRGTGQYRGTEILHDHDLTLGIAARNGDDRGPQPFGAVMGPQSAGKEPVTVGVMDDIPPVGAGRDKRAGHQFTPGVDVLEGIADHGRFTCGAGRGVDADDLLQGSGKQAVRIGVAHVLLRGEGKPFQVIQAANIGRFEAGLAERIHIKWDVGTHSINHGLKPFKLQRFQRRTGQGFDIFVKIHAS